MLYLSSSKKNTPSTLLVTFHTRPAGGLRLMNDPTSVKSPQNAGPHSLVVARSVQAPSPSLGHDWTLRASKTAPHSLPLSFLMNRFPPSMVERGNWCGSTVNSLLAPHAGLNASQSFISSSRHLYFSRSPAGLPNCVI